MCSYQFAIHEHLAKHFHDHHVDGNFVCPQCNFELQSSNRIQAREHLFSHYSPLQINLASTSTIIQEEKPSIQPSNLQIECDNRKKVSITNIQTKTQVQNCKVKKNKKKPIKVKSTTSTSKGYKDINKVYMINFNCFFTFIESSTNLTCPHCSLSCINIHRLRRHMVVHTTKRPYRCTWPDCDYTAKLTFYVEQHVRVVHFQLPPTMKEQRARKIVDNRNAKHFVAAN